MELRRRLIYAVILLLAVTTLSVGGYLWLGGPHVSFLQALYMAVITFATLQSVHAGLRRFAERARRICEQGPEAGSFAGRQAGEPRTLKLGAVEIVLRWCPPGTFTMDMSQAMPGQADSNS